jgi:glycosyltransferase involved in cell wall biosynthesis
VGQTLKEIEIILVNDGSTDGSVKIINEYAEKDDRIKVIDKPNEGYGKTMNRGIEAATGEYIGIVESDDWIELDMYETLYGIAKRHNVDVAKARHIPFDDETCKDHRISDMPEGDAARVIDPRQNPAIFYLSASIWSAIYKRDFLNDKAIWFLESPGASFQDIAFNFKIWAMVDTVYLTMKPLLHYRQHAGQSMASKDKIFCVCDEFNEVERYMASHPALFKRLETIFYQLKSNGYLWTFNRLHGENREVFRKQMQMEFVSIQERGALDLTGLPSKTRLKLLKIIYPESTWLKIRYIFGTLTRWLLKDRCRNGVIETRILFGMILVWKRAISCQGGES